MIAYTNTLEGINEEMLSGFFVGWPNPPSKTAHMKILEGSYCVWLAIDKEIDKVIGFVTAISDGVLSAYIPLLEVLPAYQNAGIGKKLVSHMLESLKPLYMVDLLCDKELQGYYAKLGMHEATGSCLRNYNRQSCE
ncbi:MAG: GNAT family N-acetyltransferase [Oscillospiraceae bacterium]|nr:GNAT family N-acetyltransferase [Oscillospiraceae bacterium]